jgi:pimeloyl-ACP methyl ester carboxylesterase
MNKIRVNGLELGWRDQGAGKPIVFLHAFPLNQSMWEDQTATLAARYRVITFDWRGFGGSERGDGQATLETFADDLAGLLDAVKLERATICGLSMGGYAAFAFHRKYGARIEALILADTRAGADDEEGKQNRLKLAEKVLQSGAVSLIDGMLPKMLGATTQQQNPSVVSRVRAMIEGAPPEGIAQASRAMAARPDSTPTLPQINCPTLILVGDEDQLTPPSESEKMSRAIPGAHLEIISGAGHLANLEQPVLFNRALEQFLTRLQP